MSTSPELQEANKILLQKRREAQQARREAGRPPGETAVSSAPGSNNNDVNTSQLEETAVSWNVRNALQEIARRRRLAGIEPDPAGETAVSGDPESDDMAGPDWEALAEKARRFQEEDTTPAPGAFAAVSPEDVEVRVSPSLAAAFLDNERQYNGAALDKDGRLWDILHAVNRAGDGPGWFSYNDVFKAITKKDSPFYLYGKRQFKNVVAEGEGLFWHRRMAGDGGELRIRLVSRHKVAAALEIGRLCMKETTFPLTYLLGHGRGRMADVRAAYYAAWHTGRIGLDQDAEKPISRPKIEELANCSGYRQRAYEDRIGMESRRNIKLLSEPGCFSNHELERARRHDQLPAFEFVDYRGLYDRHGPGESYIAILAPSTYWTPGDFAPLHSQRQRAINKMLTDDPCNNGDEGSNDAEIVRTFYQDASEAAKGYGCNPDNDAHWPTMAKTAGARVWARLPARGGA